MCVRGSHTPIRAARHPGSALNDESSLLLPPLHQHPRHQIKPRHDGAGVDIFGAGVIAEAREAKTFDHDCLAAAVGEAGVRGAAGHLIGHCEGGGCAGEAKWLSD